ncbi:ABC transporter substrate-binding protein [Rhizobium sp. RM]|uniref:ABC transporter substrate-binding protein n=1 Tax=Rhizobium sp. RM TaxID=2748079 RepID=UPI00110D71A6|nr:ABC transporter substrate-binding protein [Rhizobium sp. RM]NWJ25341.1 ABC transporter substrate-binding protein [Rhizobium sp. RM]TMV17572.1 ABC transporter substrate-binding protein [Rhizobium sp. Td3]
MKRREFNAMTMALFGAAMFGKETFAQESVDTLTSIVNPEPPILNLCLNQQTPTGVVAGKMYEGLLSYAKDLTPQPLLADTWDISEDGLTYTFHLARNAKWHDGEPFTSADVVFSCKTLLPEVHPRARDVFNRCEDISAPDAHTVVFRLKKPFPAFLMAFETASAPMAPKHLLEEKDFRKAGAEQEPIGTGPFRLTEWIKGSHIHLTAFEDYYREGQPKLKEIFYRVVPDAASRSVSLEQGEAQLAQWQDIEPFDAERLSTLPHLAMTTEGYEYFSPMLWVELNCRKPPMNDKRFRQALMHLIDRNFVRDRIMFGLANAATGPIASSMRFYDADVKTYETSVDKAASLLDDMGLKPDASGTRVTLKFTMVPAGDTWTRIAEYVRQACGAAGIKIELQSNDLAGWVSAVSNGDFDISGNQLYQNGDPALGVARTYISSNIRKGVMFSNTSGYSNPKVDELFEAAAVELDQGKRQTLYSEVQKLLVEEAPVIWLCEQKYPTIYDNRLKDLITTSTGVNSNFGNAHFG